MGNEIPKHIEQAQKTGVLQLKKFRLPRVPDEVFHIAQSLRTLDISFNEIRDLKGNFLSKFTNLKTLNLEHNRIDKLPDEIKHITRLETLNLNHNNLYQLPQSISELKNLKNIYLNHNNFNAIPYELCNINQLDHLDLSFNRIEKIDDQVSDLYCIELNLNENRINYISSNISQCPRLKVLRLEHNLLELNNMPVSLLKDSKVSLMQIDGNLFTQKQLQELDGFDKYMDRYTATKRKFD